MSDTLTERPTAWTIQADVTDLGRWLPDDSPAAARLIAAVNTWRSSNDAKPKVFRDFDGQTCLKVTIGGDEVFLDPGEHLTRVDLPMTTGWSALTPAQLAELFPEEWSA